MGDSVLSRLKRLAPVMTSVPVPRGRRSLHVMPTSCGYELRRDEVYDWDGLRRGRVPFTVLQHTVAGEGALAFEGRRHRVGPGETMLVIVPHRHRYWLEPNRHWEYFWLSTTGQEAVAIQRDIQAAAGPVLRLAPETVERLAGACLRLIEGEPATPGAASAVTYEALMALYDDVLFPQAAQGQEGDDGVARSVRHIRADLSAPLGVPELARVARLSRARFTRVFSAHEGVPPAEFVMRERMTQAARLLAREGGSVKDVASICGFPDSNYFAKAFRRTFGVSPTEFRTTGMYASVRRSFLDSDDDQSQR